MGIILGISDILTLNPKRLQKILDYKQKEKINKFNEQMGVAWEIGRLVGLAFNNPKLYPKRPTTYKEQSNEPQTKEDYIRQWRAFVEQNRIN